ncbi:MAG: hypothetical protein QOF00_4002 [Pseudonocardiales bacterium]|nr:hypothetical protein [Pseudonocardiales bacterium]
MSGTSRYDRARPICPAEFAEARRKGTQRGSSYLSIIDAATGREITTVDARHKGAIAVAQDGRRLVVSSTEGDRGELLVHGIPSS